MVDSEPCACSNTAREAGTHKHAGAPPARPPQGRWPQRGHRPVPPRGGHVPTTRGTMRRGPRWGPRRSAPGGAPTRIVRIEPPEHIPNSIREIFLRHVYYLKKWEKWCLQSALRVGTCRAPPPNFGRGGMRRPPPRSAALGAALLGGMPPLAHRPRPLAGARSLSRTSPPPSGEGPGGWRIPQAQGRRSRGAEASGPVAAGLGLCDAGGQIT